MERAPPTIPSLIKNQGIYPDSININRGYPLTVPDPLIPTVNANHSIKSVNVGFIIAHKGPITAPLYFFIRSLTASTHIFFNCPLCSDSISVNPDKILIIKFSPNILYQEYFIIFYHESQVPCFLLLLYPLQLFEKSRFFSKK